ncbi:MAG: hypothetical protein Q8M02_00860 [Candidatus Didemnitutus sp.]|nr:hypothetical protein [Candidatus Didemnitutus sp.]
MTPTRVATPTEEERMRRIGAFVCRVAQFEPRPPCALPPPPVPAPALIAAPDERVLAYLCRVREASPVEIRLTLGLSRSMTYRSLQRLALIGRVASHGSTKSVLYRAIDVDPSRN